MAGIFLSGGSGSGKTTFCKTMSTHYQLPLIVDVLRGIHKTNPDISNLSTNEKQLIYATEYLKLHHTTEPSRFISDRSLLNVLAFWGLAPEVAQYLGLQTKAPDLIILIPVPSFQWYRSHIEYFSDEIRISTYKERAGVTKSFMGEEDVATLFYQQDREMFKRMEAMCEYLEWPFFIPEIERGNSDGFQAAWQTQAHDVILQAWKIDAPLLEEFSPKEQERLLLRDRIKKMRVEEVPIEDYENRIKRGDLNGTDSTD